MGFSLAMFGETKSGISSMSSSGRQPQHMHVRKACTVSSFWNFFVFQASFFVRSQNWPRLFCFRDWRNISLARRRVRPQSTKELTLFTNPFKNDSALTTCYHMAPLRLLRLQPWWSGIWNRIVSESPIFVPLLSKDTGCLVYKYPRNQYLRIRSGTWLL